MKGCKVSFVIVFTWCKYNKKKTRYHEKIKDINAAYGSCLDCSVIAVV